MIFKRYELKMFGQVAAVSALVLGVMFSIVVIWFHSLGVNQ